VAPGLAGRPKPRGFSLDQDPTRRWAYSLREASRTILLDLGAGDYFRGLVTCGYPSPMSLGGKALSVGIYADPEGGVRARVAGLLTCGSVWACPVCATTAADERSEALARVVARRWSKGWRVAHAVLTVRHTRGEPLADVLGALTTAWRHLVSHRRVKKLLRGWDWHRGWEITYGKNGWHPHVHLLLLSPPGVDPYLLEEPLWEAWEAAVRAVGWAPSSRGGYVFQVPGGEEDVIEVARYQEKWGIVREGASGPQKAGGAGLSPWELLELAAQEVVLRYEEDEVGVPGIVRLDTPGVLRPPRPARGFAVSPDVAQTLWVEYVEATKGRKRTGASRALARELRQELEALQAEWNPGELQAVVRLDIRAYMWLLRTARLAYWLHWLEVAGPEVAAELVGLVPDEWTVLMVQRAPPQNTPLESAGV